MRKLLIAALLFAAAAMMTATLEAAPRKVPVAALKALKGIRGKPITTGMVFMDGKYIEPPYVVERYGTAIRINKVQITGPLIPWDEFLKTQAGAKVITSTTEVGGSAEAPAEEEPEEEAEEESIDDDDPLAALFDDEPAPKKTAKAKKPAKRKPAGPRQVTTTKVEFDGEFQMNGACQKLIAKINNRRTAIDQQLRNGGFYFFGTRYSATGGDASTATKLLKALPEAMRAANSGERLSALCRSNGIGFLNDLICNDLYANRSDYIKLINRRKKMEEEEQFQKLMKRR